ncbi:MAG: hypothetical protein ABIB61_00600 [Candidatus Shapirobacteria bacterium]
MAKKNSLLACLLQTLAYAKVYSFPLTQKELYQRLISPPPNSYSSFSSFCRKLNYRVKQKKIGQTCGYYFLPGAFSLIARRKKLEKNWPDKFELAKKSAQILKKIPEVFFVGLSGNLSLGIAQPKDDIDLLIITAPNSLWIARLKIYYLLKSSKFPVRQPGKKDAKNKLCLNLYLDFSNLTLPKYKQNLFNAYQIALIKPLYSKNRTYEKFLASNSWAAKYLPNAFTPPLRGQHPRSVAFAHPWGVFSNYLAYLIQRLYMFPKKTKEKITLTQAFFHPRPKTSPFDLLARKRPQNSQH